MSDDGSREAQTTLRRLRHDMRTPLGQIIGYSEMLEEEAEDRGQADLIPDLQKIRRAARTLLEYVDGVFDPESVAGPAPVRSEPAGVPGESRAEPRAGSHEGYLLVVDDDAQNRDLLLRRLERVGYRVHAVGDGAGALRAIEEERLDLVLLDVLMPGMSGIEVLKAIRSTHSPSELPVIMATALGGSDDVVDALHQGANDYVTKPFDLPVVLARVETQLSLKRATAEIEALAQQLEIRNAFVRHTFGRYVSDEVVSSILESAEGLEIRGEKRRVTILMADLRGFSALTERLAPVDTVSTLNRFLGSMAEVIQSHDGTIDEFQGDGILAFFGAPITREDDAGRAVACAIDMQRALDAVNADSGSHGLPQLEMGVGIATGDVIVGNVGSEKRTKYGAVGSAINLASRIVSHALGGEVLISPNTREELRDLVRIDAERRISPKGFDGSLPIHRVLAIDGRWAVRVPVSSETFVDLPEPIAIRLAHVDGKDVSQVFEPAELTAWSERGARVRAERSPAEMAELCIELLADDGTPVPGGCYARVVEPAAAEGRPFTLRLSTRSLALDDRVRRSLEAL